MNDKILELGEQVQEGIMVFQYENFSTRVFRGLYESIIFNSDTFFNIAYNENIPDGYSLSFLPDGYKQFKEEVARSFVENLDKECFSSDKIDLEFIKPIEIVSPSQYNFITDRVVIEVSFDLEKLKNYCFVTKEKEFDEYLHKHWSSRDGFWSHVPNNISTFKKDAEDYIDIMFEFFLLQEIDLDNVNCCTAEDAYEWLYCNHCLERESDGSLWDYSLGEKDEYIPMNKLKQEV